MKAFPSAEDTRTDRGMDLRDYFAAKAMQGLLISRDDSYTKETVTRWAYEMADAMMKAREQ
jgi:hypothetical protein